MRDPAGSYTLGLLLADCLPAPGPRQQETTGQPGRSMEPGTGFQEPGTEPWNRIPNIHALGPDPSDLPGSALST